MLRRIASRACCATSRFPSRANSRSTMKSNSRSKSSVASCVNWTRNVTNERPTCAPWQPRAFHRGFLAPGPLRRSRRFAGRASASEGPGRRIQIGFVADVRRCAQPLPRIPTTTRLRRAAVRRRRAIPAQLEPRGWQRFSWLIVLHLRYTRPSVKTALSTGDAQMTAMSMIEIPPASNCAPFRSQPEPTSKFDCSTRTPRARSWRAPGPVTDRRCDRRRAIVARRTAGLRASRSSSRRRFPSRRIRRRPAGSQLPRAAGLWCDPIQALPDSRSVPGLWPARSLPGAAHR